MCQLQSMIFALKVRYGTCQMAFHPHTCTTGCSSDRESYRGRAHRIPCRVITGHVFWSVRLQAFAADTLQLHHLQGTAHIRLRNAQTKTMERS